MIKTNYNILKKKIQLLMLPRLQIEKIIFNYINHVRQQGCENNPRPGNSDRLSCWHWLDCAKSLEIEHDRRP